MLYDFHPAAQLELQEAISFYDSISFELGDDFLANTELTIDRIIKFPEAWTKISANARRCRIAGFPYGIIYQIAGQRILIVAVMHLQRKPNYWTNRA